MARAVGRRRRSAATARTARSTRSSTVPADNVTACWFARRAACSSPPPPRPSRWAAACSSPSRASSGPPARAFAGCHDHRRRRPRHPLPDLAGPRRLRRDEPRPRLLGRLRRAEDRPTDGLEGHGFTFTIGRGNELCVAAIEALAPLRGRPRPRGGHAPTSARFWRTLTGDSQLRWLGPEKGVIHLATAAVVNAVWDLWAQDRGQAAVEAARGPDARAVRRAASTSATSPTRSTPAEALRAAARSAPPARPSARAEMRARRLSRLHHLGRLARLHRRQDPPAAAARRSPTGWTHFKMKVGGDARGRRRAARAIVREEIGPERRADDRRQPGLGRRRGDRVDAAPWREFEPLLDRGADQPRRRPRPRRDRRARSRRSASPPASTARTA